MKEWFKSPEDLDPARSATRGPAEDPEAERRRLARERARAKLKLYQHLALYLVVNLSLLALNLVVTPATLWFYWAAAGWGLGIAAHGVKVYLFGHEPVLLHKLEERELRKMAQRE